MKYRMYILVPYNLSSIQKGIQALHAVVEYANKYSNRIDYKQWAEVDKTVIILNGGTTNKTLLANGKYKGSLDNCLSELISNDIPCASFYEEDDNDALTGVAVIADERVWDKIAYPGLEIELYPEHPDYINWLELIGGQSNVILRNILNTKPLAN